MPSSSSETPQGLHGRLTTDYFEFQCSKCQKRIQNLIFYAIDTVGVQLLARCDECDFSYIFKVRSKPMLGPIQLTKHLGKTAFKTYDKRRLNKRLKELGHPNIAR